MTRRTTELQRNALKTAFKQLVEDVGGIVAAAACTRVGTSQLSDYGNIGSEKMAPADVILDLEAIGGRPRVTGEMARLQGMQILPRDARSHHELVACLQRIASDNGQLFSQAVGVLSAGKASAADRGRMAAELADVIQAAQEAMQALEVEI